MENPIGTDKDGTNQFIWRVNSQGLSIARIDIVGDTSEERTKSLLSIYGRNNYEKRDKLSKQYGYKTPFIVCLSQAETGIGGAKKTLHNYFNCGNNQRGDTLNLSSLEHSFRSLHDICLNGTYLRQKTTLSHLNPAHAESSCNTNREDQCQFVYASSQENRGNNIMNCLSNIYQEQIDMEYTFRR